MNNITRTLFALVGLGFATLAVQAQPAPKILVVALDKVFDAHYRTEAESAKLRADELKAKETLDKLVQEGNVLVEEYKNLDEQSKNPAATAEAKSKAQAAAESKVQEIQHKQNEAGNFQQQAQRSLQQRMQSFRSVLLEEITKIASEIAKKKGATFLVDKSGPSLIGVSNILYSDPAYDITDEVLKEVNKDRPAAAPAAVAPATPPSASTFTQPAANDTTITVPGAPKK